MPTNEDRERLPELESSSQSTIAFYEEHAREYFARTVHADLTPIYDKFFPRVPQGGRILDLGAGSGRDLKEMKARGFEPLGIDASRALCEMASEYSGSKCLPIQFEDLDFVNEFEAAWACASLLHVRKSKLKPILERVHRALVSGGVACLSVQLGEGQVLSPDGRFFAYYEPSEFAGFIEKAGFVIDTSWISRDTLAQHRTIEWINVIAEKSGVDDAKLDP